jgi:hypothetical protein
MWHVLQSEPSFFAPSPTISVCKPATLLVSSLDEVHSFTASACRKLNSPPPQMPKKEATQVPPLVLLLKASGVQTSRSQGLKLQDFKASRLQGSSPQVLKLQDFKLQALISSYAAIVSWWFSTQAPFHHRT